MSIQHDEKSLFLKQLDKRTSSFKRNIELETLLRELAGYLGPIEKKIEDTFVGPQIPVLFLIGNPRSGTSVFMQFLAMSGQFAVPTNILSRFYYAPYIGAKIQLLLTDKKYDYRNELKISTDSFDLSSDLGKTSGMLGPSEFFHFWRRFLPRYDPEYLNEKDIKKVDFAGLRKGIAAIEYVFCKPFAVKAIILQYNMHALFNALPNCLIVHMRREPIYVMQSILCAREKFYGNRDTWWSVKPKEFNEIVGMDIYHQIAGQVYYTETAIDAQLQDIPQRNQLYVRYEDFCNNPQKVYLQISEKYSALGYKINSEYKTRPGLKSSNRIKISKVDIRKLEKAYKYFSV